MNYFIHWKAKERSHVVERRNGENFALPASAATAAEGGWGSGLMVKPPEAVLGDQWPDKGMASGSRVGLGLPYSRWHPKLAGPL